MTYTLDYDTERHIITGKMWGNIDASVVKQMAADLLPLMQMHNCYRVLNDLRYASISSETIQIYNMPRSVASVKVPAKTKRALVLREVTDDFLFLETASINAGQRLKLFTDLESARAWLLSDR